MDKMVSKMQTHIKYAKEKDSINTTLMSRIAESYDDSCNLMTESYDDSYISSYNHLRKY